LATANKELALAAFEAVADGNMDALDNLIAVDYVRHCQATPDVQVNSLEDFKKYLLGDRESFPDPDLRVVHLIAEDNLVAFWATYAGVQEGPIGQFPATGNRMEIAFAGIHRIEDGKIAETWVIWDNLAALTQLGLWPPPELEEIEIVD
jgi:steroid delta-isomerase-like uncharacterized protein